jgi:hypothetical protein
MIAEIVIYLPKKEVSLVAIAKPVFSELLATY